MSDVFFQIEDLRVSIEGKEVLKGVDLEMKHGEVHAFMGKNGSGKTTLAYTLMGHPKYQVTSGRIVFNGEDISDLPPDERAKKRIFLAFQHPIAIPGVTVANFLRTSVRAVRGSELPPKEFRKRVKEELKALHIPESFMRRALNDGFSGGERKRLETLQLRLLEPQLAVLDETDSGLDIDALKDVSERIESMRDGKRGILLITHYQRMLNYVKPDHVHVFLDGKIARSGGLELAHQLEEQGYEFAKENHD